MLVCGTFLCPEGSRAKPINYRLSKSSNGHIPGDSAYPYDMFLMCPYCDIGSLTARQKYFSMLLSFTRVIIEQTFGLLKGRFKRPKFPDMLDLNLVCEVIAIACDLHNLCIRNNDATEVEADIKVATGSFDADQDEDDNVPVNIGFVK